ncbi:MAG: hypothetical protein AAFV88_09640 [Planctomycetota bacterium]
MEIERLAHRGFWHQPSEKNTQIAFKRALEADFGIETDLRDHGGIPVISHDPPNGPVELTFEQFLQLYKEQDSDATLALNIKADGLAAPVKRLLRDYEVQRYFVFDMSIPDMLHYLRAGLATFCRQSEYENPGFLAAEDGIPAIQGIWLDSFRSIWYSTDVIRVHLQQGRDVCLVSPELHRRDHASTWDQWRHFVAQTITEDMHGKLLLCTDYPDQF